MKVEDFENLKSKIEELKNKKSRAEGALEQVKDQLKKDFGVNDLKEASLLLEKIDKEIKSDQSKLDELLEEIENITDWDKI